MDDAAIDALARTHRVITFSLGDPASGSASAQPGFDAWVSHIDDLLDRAGERGPRWSACRSAA